MKTTPCSPCLFFSWQVPRWSTFSLENAERILHAVMGALITGAFDATLLHCHGKGRYYSNSVQSKYKTPVNEIKFDQEVFKYQSEEKMKKCGCSLSSIRRGVAMRTTRECFIFPLRQKCIIGNG